MPRCVFPAVDSHHYLEASGRVMQTLRQFPAVVQVMGWDEAFMAVETDEPEWLARDVQQAVLERTGLWCSIGNRGHPGIVPSSPARSPSAEASSGSPARSGRS